MWSWLLALAMEDWVFHVSFIKKLYISNSCYRTKLTLISYVLIQFVKLFFSRARFDFGRAASSMMGDSQSNICLKDNGMSCSNESHWQGRISKDSIMQAYEFA